MSQGLSRRLDAAYYLAVGGLALGIVASLLKGADFEEATLLALLLVVLWRARPAFDRRAALFDARVLARLDRGGRGDAGRLGLAGPLRLQARRVLPRAVVAVRARPGGVALPARLGRGGRGLALFGFGRLLRPAPQRRPSPRTPISRPRRVIAAQAATFPYLVFLRDKALLFDEDRKGFVMYGVQGRTWVALGDPVGPPERLAGLVRLFLERCDDFGGVPVFYEVGKEGLHHYADFGLTFVKLGEEARVDLSSFSLEGRRPASTVRRSGGSRRRAGPSGSSPPPRCRP